MFERVLTTFPVRFDEAMCTFMVGQQAQSGRLLGNLALIDCKPKFAEVSKPHAGPPGFRAALEVSYTNLHYTIYAQ